MGYWCPDHDQRNHPKNKAFYQDLYREQITERYNTCTWLTWVKWEIKWEALFDSLNLDR